VLQAIEQLDKYCYTHRSAAQVTGETMLVEAPWPPASVYAMGLSAHLAADPGIFRRSRSMAITLF
jgi:hypothetical protein